MAHTKAKGTTKLGRDSAAKRLGLKVSGGQMVLPGRILIRQRGTRFLAGAGTALGKDDTVYAKTKGRVMFADKIKYGIRGRRQAKEVRVVEGA